MSIERSPNNPTKRSGRKARHLTPLAQRAPWVLRLYSQLSDRMLEFVSVRRRRLLSLLEDIAMEVRSWPGIAVRPHRFGRTEFVLGTMEVGHYHGDGTVDVLFTRPVKSRLLGLGRARQHRYAPDSGVVSFFVGEATDTVGAILLLELSYVQKSLRLARRAGANPPLSVDELRERLFRLETDRELLTMLDPFARHGEATENERSHPLNVRATLHQSQGTRR